MILATKNSLKGKVEPTSRFPVIKQITESNPLLVLSQPGSFLHYTIVKMLTIADIAHEVKEISAGMLENREKIVDHQAPLIVFDNVVM